ncbi:FGGY-family carbohydrate kinase [Pelagibacterium sp. H642]|uniref:FGGY-family carbohydrate kinase n=1 Tax=Pelagibacterium sp. H642 TaxID=1881069 RepID=UPI002814B164|nr:FGGY-family carbohydrate kinase [Pelagibacterium sp. H642]WMT91858.1 FGGY-family carbohydrate kinase [Pelagibacterium sp. H642]
MSALLVAVDVGTTSARAGVVTAAGALLARAQAPIAMRREGAERGEHDSEDIWRSVCAAVREAVAQAGCDPAEIAAIGFAATCSLVVRDGEGRPLPLGGEGWDTIAWFDHRALGEAEEINATGHSVLGYSGGALSPEMEIPKLLWLKRNRPEIWARAGMMFDLADFLTWKACGSGARSQSTLTGKWCFLAHEEQGWRSDFLRAVGLDDLLERAGLPQGAAPVGARLGTLTPHAAQTLGLAAGTVVATGMVDAHAGALGLLGGEAETDRHLGLIAGTSSAVVALASQPRPMRGIWGPYYGAVLPGLWFSEGGQSASGAALDYVLGLYGLRGAEAHEEMIARIERLRQDEPELAPRLHVLPDFHGNRSPLADPHALGVISGLTLDGSLDGLARLYWRTMVGLALGVRQILQTLNAKGYAIDTLHVAGGHTRNRLLIGLYADATGCAVRRLSGGDAMLLGAAMAAASAAGIYPGPAQAARAMRNGTDARAPGPSVKALYDRDYAVFLRMQEHRAELEAITKGG